MSEPEALFAAQSKLAAARRSGFDRAARLAALGRLRQAILARRAEIEAALQADFGKHPTEVLLTEIVPVLQEISHARRHLRRWMRVRRVWPSLTMLGASGRIVPQPKGVALIIAPWNFPVNLALGPLVSALAAGCSAVLKPSEMTPATSALLARMLGETFPPDLVAVVEGGPEVAGRLLELPFDHIFFTGSPAVGRIVMAAAAKTLASVTLELGGKSPVIVGPEANLSSAAKWLAWGKFFNAGQTCIAPDHVFVHASVAGALEGALRAEIGRMYGSDLARSPAMAKVVNTRHWRRLRGLVDGALAGGARVVEGGAGEEAVRSMAPVILTGTTDNMQISQEEIFGPVLPLIPYDALDPVLERINAGPKPLALYVFGNKALANEVTARTASGSVGVNLTVMPFIHPNLPFGGIGNSGLGAAHGHEGFRAFSHEKPVLVNRFLAMPLLFPPYSGRVRRLAEVLLRLVR